jgi:hypothetical protein
MSDFGEKTFFFSEQVIS